MNFSKIKILYHLICVSQFFLFRQVLNSHNPLLFQSNHHFYIIVLSKLDGKVYLQSVKSLRKINSNGSNLPFQVKWGNNTEPVERTYLQAYNFLIECYKESVIKKITSHDGFEEL